MDALFSAQSPTVNATDIDFFPDGLPVLYRNNSCAICLHEVNDTLTLECSHTFCSSCLDGQLDARWPGERMTFGYLNCALCRAPLAHTTLEQKLRMHLDLKSRAENAAVQKFLADGLLEELQEELCFHATEYDIKARAADYMAVFQCCDCKEPFCAGRVSCEAFAQPNEVNSTITRCPACAWTAAAHVNDHRCMVHGHKYAMFKCDSCCAVATWNCYSNHYCDRCHNQAAEAKHYPCPGPEKCPLGMPHPPNCAARHGRDEMASFCIGCMACAGFMEVADSLDFNDKNIFGFPEREWLDFADGVALLAQIGEEEVRARLKVRAPNSVAQQDSLSALLCAEWLLPLEVAQFESDRIDHEIRQQRDEFQREKQDLEYQLEVLEYQRHYEMEYMREEIDYSREEQEREERDRKQLKNETEWIEVFKEYSLTPQAYDVMFFKSLREANHARNTFCKAARRKGVTWKANRILHKRRKDFRTSGNCKPFRNSSRMQCYRRNWEMNLNFRFV